MNYLYKNIYHSHIQELEELNEILDGFALWTGHLTASRKNTQKS